MSRNRCGKSGCIGHRIPFRDHENRKLNQLGNNCPHNNFHGWGKEELDTFLEEGGDEAETLREVGQEFSAIRSTTKEGTELLEVGRYEYVGEGGNLGDVRATATRVDGVAEKIGVGGENVCL